jgi:hypothetical protein
MTLEGKNETPTLRGYLDRAIRLNGTTLAAFSAASEAWLEASLYWQQSMARFVGARMKDSARVRQSFSACQNWDELFRLQQDWCETSASAYINEIILLPKFAAKFFHGASRFLPSAEVKAFAAPRQHAAE